MIDTNHLKILLQSAFQEKYLFAVCKITESSDGLSGSTQIPYKNVVPGESLMIMVYDAILNLMLHS